MLNLVAYVEILLHWPLQGFLAVLLQGAPDFQGFSHLTFDRLAIMAHRIQGPDGGKLPLSGFGIVIGGVGCVCTAACYEERHRADDR